MYKLVVVDDEYIVIEGIKALILKLELPFEIVGYANDGISALDVIINTNPDLVITDIRMPVINGISLIKQAKEFCPNTIFVVISGYMEFEYARKALILGVKDYIDKPISKDKLKNLLERMEVLISDNKEETLEENFRYKSYGKLQELLKVSMGAITNKDTEEFHKISIKIFNLLDNLYPYLNDLKREVYKVVYIFFDILSSQDETLIMEEQLAYKDINVIKNKSELSTFYKKAIISIGQFIEAKNTGASHTIVLKVLEYIKENYNKDISLTELGDMVNMHPAYLSSLFKDEVGMTYIKYITDLRITNAKKLLNEGFKVNEASLMVGYNNYRHFGNLFKKYTGLTPNEYKKNKENLKK